MASSRGFPNLEKSEFVYFMEKHVEYEFEAFKDIFERFDEDGSLGEKGSNGPTGPPYPLSAVVLVQQWSRNLGFI